MYNKLSLLKLKHLYVLVFLLLSSIMARGQSATLNITPAVACAGVDLTTVEVTTSGIAAADIVSYTIRWGIPNDTAVNNRIAGNAPNQFFFKKYATGGDYVITVVVKRSNGPDIVVTANRRIWNRPVTSFILQSPDNQCFKNNNYVFNNTSTRGAAPSAPLVKADWIFGDGNSATITNMSQNILNHKYTLNKPTYQIGLTMTDSVGCKTDPQSDPLSTLPINIAPDINPGFTISGIAQCDTSKYIFQNTTPLQYSFVDSFVWDYGDGTKYFSGVPGKQTQDFARWNNAYQHMYTTAGVFYPSLFVYDKRSGCADSFYFQTSGLKLPENIIYEIEILTKRSPVNDSLGDSVCLMVPNAAFVTLYNNFALEGPGGTPLNILWSFNDPNANPPGSDRFLNVFQPRYQYQGLGQYFPTLTVSCPGLPAKVRTYTYYSKIDTLPKDPNRYQYEDFMAAPKPNVPQYVNSFGPRLNPTLYTRKGRVLSPTSNLDTLFYNTNGRIPKLIYDTTYNASDPTDVDKIVGRFDGWGDEMSSDWDFFRKADMAFIPTFYDTQMVQFRNPQTSTLITRPVLTPYYNPISRARRFKTINDPNVHDSLEVFKDALIGLGVQIQGPMVRIEDPNTPITIAQWQKLQCGPTFPVQFVNTSLIYQSDRLWKRWDFAEDQYAPACTSYSIPNPVAAGNGLPPYLNAADLQNRTLGAFVANGRSYLGRFTSCNFSHDSLPTRLYHNWDVIFNWNKYGHDFPPYDTTRWTKGYTQWPTSQAPPTGKNWVQPQDTSGGPTWWPWNQPVLASGPTPTRVDTMANIWPNDIQPNNVIRLNNPIPDPISSARGNWMDVIPVGTRIDTGLLVISLPNANDGKPRQYRGSDLLPGTNITLYRYAFNRQTIQDITVTLQMKDSINNTSQDPDYRTLKTKFDTIKIYDPITHTYTKDSIIRDSLYLDEWDCHGSSTVQLSFTRPDAFGLSQDGKVCPNFKSGSSGGDPQIILNRAGYLDSSRTQPGPGIVPSSSRTFLLINYDSLLDRNDATPCDLDNFVDFSGAHPGTGGATPGGLTMPGMYNRVNYPPTPGGPWTSPSGARIWAHYFPSGPTPGGIANMPYSNKGWITLGIIVGTGCATPTNCNSPGCLSDTVWYHNFFRFIQLNASFTIEKFAYEDPAKPNFCYLRGKGDTVTFHYFDSLQDNVIADVWDWGDGTATVDSFYYQPETDEPYNRIRYEFNTQVLPWVCYDTTYYPIGTRVFTQTVRDTIWRCNDPLHALPPQRIDVRVINRDTSFMLLPIKHVYKQSSWEMLINGGNGLERRADITPVLHNMIANNFSRCENRALKYIVVGIIDTFDVLNGAGELDTIFCQGESVYFRDSVRYWYTAGTGVCSRPLQIPGENNDRLDELVDKFGPALINYPTDTTKIYPDFTDYFILPGTQVCPTTHFGAAGTDPVSGLPITRCYKLRTYYFERLYWDFESDGMLDAVGSSVPGVYVTNKYSAPGRYKVSMITRDSLGYWDTCYRYVNIVHPHAAIEAKDVYQCGDEYLFKDSSYIGGAPGFDNVNAWKWWFGDIGFAQDAYRSDLQNPKYDYRKNGKYTLQLAINTEQGCTDTIRKDIFISGPRPHLFILDDTLGCVPHRVRVVSIPERETWASPTDTPTKLTIIRSGRPDNLAIPIKYSTIDTVEFIYDQPGTYYIFAEAFDSETGKGVCRPITVPDTLGGFEAPIRIRTNVPYKVDLESSKDTVCVGEVFKFTNKSDRDTIDRYRLDVFNSTLSSRLDSVLKTDINVDTTWQYKLNQIGQYKFVLVSTRFQYGYAPCANTDTVTVVASKAKADFTPTQAGESTFRLVNNSDTSVSDKYTWKVYKADGSLFDGYPKDFDDVSPLNDYTAKFDVDSSTSLTVCIIADVAGTVSCPDSVCKVIQIILPPSKINIPNAFSPNGDNINDNFVIEIENFRKYSLTIWNRWGNTVFESDTPTKTWNGKTNNDGGENPAGTYYYIFTYQLKGGPEKTVRGSITLIK